MPRINLLPVRAARKVDSARNELIAILVGLLALLGVQYYWYASVEGDVAELEERIVQVRVEIGQLEKQVVKVKDFKKQAETLENKLSVIEELKAQKVGPAKMLDDLAQIMTRLRTVWLTSFATRGVDIIIEGAAMEHEDISALQIALEKESPFFKRVRLTLVTAVKERDVKFLEWRLVCQADFSSG